MQTVFLCPLFLGPNSRTVTYVLVVGAIFQLASETKALGGRKAKIECINFTIVKKRSICVRLTVLKVDVNAWQLVRICYDKVLGYSSGIIGEQYY